MSQKASFNLDTKPEGEAVSVAHKVTQPAVMARNLVTDPWDSGIDSDGPLPFEPGNGGYDQPMSLDTVFRRIMATRLDNYDLPEPGRVSPPLDEVELTASDEDDDASVLELVIPMQSRYQRVPTSSPKKTKPKYTTLLALLFCCMRK